jgi:hypothetical protein
MASNYRCSSASEIMSFLVGDHLLPTLTPGFTQHFLQLLVSGMHWHLTANLQLQLSILDCLPSWINLLPTAELSHKVKVIVSVMLQLTVSWTVYLGVKPHLGPQDQIFVTVRQFVHVRRPFWLEDESVICNCCWLSRTLLSDGFGIAACLIYEAVV